MNFLVRLKRFRLKLIYIKSALRYKTYDYGYMLDTMRKQIDLMIFDHEHNLFYENWEDFRYVYIAKSILDELFNDSLKYADVNLRNKNRFSNIRIYNLQNDTILKWEVRHEKLYNILSLIFRDKIYTWWD